jgi:thiol-disulfide isomerase/thioredoxin
MSKKKDKKPGKLPDKGPDKWPENTPDTPPDHGQDKKIRKAAFLLAVVVLGCAAIIGIYFLTMSPSSPVQGTGTSNVTVYYFYGKECPHCENVRPYIESLQKKYPDVNFRVLEIWHDATNKALADLMNHNLNQQQSLVPEVIVGNVVLMGETEISTRLEGTILEQKRNLTASS